MSIVGEIRRLEQFNGVACPTTSGAGQELHWRSVRTQVESIQEGQPIRSSLVEDAFGEDCEQMWRDVLLIQGREAEERPESFQFCCAFEVAKVIRVAGSPQQAHGVVAAGLWVPPSHEQLTIRSGRRTLSGWERLSGHH
ncbi:MAG: hypothetical protein QM714_01965 [Nocardioides sp.]|uniref:hypothetical protein n=1 Tax=Nocardioides sp. TaxID=35761 RepID=UPI0039E3E6A5